MSCVGGVRGYDIVEGQGKRADLFYSPKILNLAGCAG
jgi:hypothetical protein